VRLWSRIITSLTKEATMPIPRRSFLHAACALPVAAPAINLLAVSAGSDALLALPDDSKNLDIIGPREGYSPQIGILVSMMNWMRFVMLRSVQGMNQDQLDFLLDDKANRIGAMLFHLAATDHYYQLQTFGNIKWGSWSDDEKKKWDVAMNLGEPARKEIKGHDLNYYLDILTETREKTLAEFRKRDDKWLASVDDSFPWGPTNNFCKWFHVCEHESNHNGQIKLIKSRLPGTKPSE
jgi:Protein of unknown function (DUF664)